MQKYTVVIPTRDRAETLSATLRTCLRQKYPNFEIIVSDNCSEDNTKEIVHSFNDPRIKYINPGKRLSMSGNFEFSLGHVHDGFVMFIGSDDGIMPDAIEYVDSIVKKYKVDAVSGMQATYVWPEFPDESIAGNFTFGSLRNDIELRKSSEWINKTISFNAPYCFDLPNLYCGFVHIDVVKKAYINGKYFRSITPDAFSAFATAIFADKYAFSHKPFCIAGASAKSNGASTLNPKGKRDEGDKFFAENDIPLSEGFIKCASYEVILGEAFAQIKNAFPIQCRDYELDYSTMLKKSLANANSKTSEEIESAVKVMENNFSSKTNKYVKKNPQKDRGKILRKLAYLASAYPRRHETLSISASHNIGINNIDDAALAAFLLNNPQRHQHLHKYAELLFKTLAASLKIGKL
jgi:glycosyltransferase involved in cell wall biosynthesis